MTDKKDSTTLHQGTVFHLREGQQVFIHLSEGEIQITYEGKARKKGNRASIRVSAPDGMNIRSGPTPGRSGEGQK